MKKQVHQLGLVLLSLLIISACDTDPVQMEITLSNPSGIDLSDKAISLERSRLGQVPDGEAFPLVISSGGDTIPSQLDDLDGDQHWDELFFLADLSAGESITYSLEWMKESPVYPVRTSVRFGKRLAEDIPVKPALEELLTARAIPWTLGFQRYQTDGPSWENDRVGFRHYLDGRNAKDVFGKRIPDISPGDVGLDEKGATVDNYHVMEDWGRDILSVGNSVGIGGFGLLAGEDFLRLGIIAGDTVSNVEETRFRILTEGPVRSALGYSYANWRPGNNSYDVEEQTHIWPGMYGYQNSVRISGLQGDEELIVGLVNIHTDMLPSEINGNEKYVVLYTHDQQTYDKEWWLGLALILPREQYLGYTEAPESGQLTNSYLARLRIEEDKPLSYYAVACWELSDQGFTDRAYFEAYVKDLAEQLAVEVEINTGGGK